MTEPDLAAQFEQYRPHLTAVAYRMLGSQAEADDAVQDAWLRFDRAGVDGVDNPGGWLTTIVARVCLNMLRARAARRERSLDGHLPDPVVSREDGYDPERQAVLADSVGIALQVVLDTLPPAERLAFVLHDVFGQPFGDIAPMVGRTPAATRQLASRARRRVRGAELPRPDADLATQRRVVDAFFAAARAGDFDALVALLDPDVVLRSDGGARRPRGVGGATRGRCRRGSRRDVRAPRRARQAGRGERRRRRRRDRSTGRPVSVMGFTVTNGRIVEIHSLLDPERLARLDLSVLGDGLGSAE